ncbi:MAG: hypothetical protein KKG75_02045 [Nanoarchaeota archaeon]|nr:hypothetical protein [Nanoarchaeota archaeon]
MVIKSLVLGFFAKIVTGFDDTLTHVPVIASLTRTKRGRFAFGFGILLGIGVAIMIALFFSTWIKGFRYFRYVVAVLLFSLAGLIYFDILVTKPRKKEEMKLKKLKKPIGIKRISKLIGIGFVASFVTVLDDTVAYSSLFLKNGKIFAIIGILTAAILEILVVIYFSKKISGIKYKEKIASIGLLILGVLVLLGIL